MTACAGADLNQRDVSCIIAPKELELLCQRWSYLFDVCGPRVGANLGQLCMSKKAAAAKANWDNGPVTEALSDQVRALCRLCARNRVLTSAFYAAASEYTIKIGALPDPGDDADPRTLVPMTEALELLIRYGQAAGELRPYPSARDLSGLLVNTVLIRNVNRPGESADITAELLLTVMFGSLRPEELVGAERPFPAAR